jgi:hypothetical protein
MKNITNKTINSDPSKNRISEQEIIKNTIKSNKQNQLILLLSNPDSTKRKELTEKQWWKIINTSSTITNQNELSPLMLALIFKIEMPEKCFKLLIKKSDLTKNNPYLIDPFYFALSFNTNLNEETLNYFYKKSKSQNNNTKPYNAFTIFLNTKTKIPKKIWNNFFNDLNLLNVDNRGTTALFYTIKYQSKNPLQLFTIEQWQTLYDTFEKTNIIEKQAIAKKLMEAIYKYEFNVFTPEQNLAILQFFKYDKEKKLNEFATKYIEQRMLIINNFISIQNKTTNTKRKSTSKI